MNSLILSATSIQNIVLDLVLAAIIVLYFLWGFIKGSAKPITALISWGLIILIIYFGGIYIGNLFMVNLKLEQPIREFLTNFQYVSLNSAQITSIIRYLGVIIASLLVFVIIKFTTMIINIIIKKARKPYKKPLWSRFLGAFLNMIKGALWICIILAIVYPILQTFEVVEILDYINNTTVTKFIAQNNPITMLFELIVK